MLGILHKPSPLGLPFYTKNNPHRAGVIWTLLRLTTSEQKQDRLENNPQEHRGKLTGRRPLWGLRIRTYLCDRRTLQSPTLEGLVYLCPRPSRSDPTSASFRPPFPPLSPYPLAAVLSFLLVFKWLVSSGPPGNCSVKC